MTTPPGHEMKKATWHKWPQAYRKEGHMVGEREKRGGLGLLLEGF